MRDIIAHLHMSANGIVEQPERWLPDPRLLVTGSETLLLGRTTYDALAGRLDQARKLVVTSTPVVRRPNTEVLLGSPARVLRALKDVPGEDLHVVGSVTLVRSLLEWRLLDEVALTIHPVVTGPGRPLFEEERLRLRWMYAVADGAVEASYRVSYAATATSSRSADSTGRWGGTFSSASVASNPRPAISTHA